MEHTLNEILSRAGEVTILVIGDLILDEYLWGNIDRISPEAPVPVLEWTGENLVLGGAANVAHNLMHLGTRVLLVGTVGKDEKGNKLKELLAKAGIESSGVFEDSSRPTTSKIRVLAHNQQILRIDKEASHEISLCVEESIKSYLYQVLPQIDGVICSDYQKGLLKESLLRRLIEDSRALDRPVLIDPKGRDYTCYHGATALTPNLKEAEIATGTKIDGEEDFKRAVERLFAIADCNHLLITRGKDGMTLCNKELESKSGVKKQESTGTRESSPPIDIPYSYIDIPTQTQEVFDVTGAGDTVTSVFGLGLSLGCDPLLAAKLANLAAGVVVGKLGTAPIARQELAEHLAGQMLSQHKKMLSRKELNPLLNSARSQGKRIVFTNGCFDLLHVGHIHYLQQAKALGDLLVIGLNADVSVRQLKGSERPLISQEERANVLAALSCVDYVVIFDELTPEGLIREVRPHILVKGGDYCPETVVGRDIVESHGGTVEIIPYIPGRSTSGLVEKIVNHHKPNL